MDCHGLRPRRDRSASLRTLPVFANSHPVIASATPSLRTPPRLCERSEAIHLANHAVPNHGLPRRCAPRRDRSASLRAPPSLCKRHPVIANATLSLQTPPRLCERSEAIHPSDSAVLNHGLPRRYTPRRDSGASLRTLAPSLRAPPRLCKRHPVIASAAKQSTSQNLSQQPLRFINQQL